VKTAAKFSIIGVAGLGFVTSLGFLLWKLLSTEHTLKDFAPDSSPMPGKTGWKKVDAILPQLQAFARTTGIPLGLIIGWIAKESGGRLADTTSMDERGYFQLMPAESKALGLDHQRLSTDSDYSINEGGKIIRHYQSVINDLMDGVTSAGTSYYWRLVKLAHSLGSGQVKKIVNLAKDAGHAGSWEELEDFATGIHINGPQPKKWFPFVDDSRAHTKNNSVYRVGKPFGFGSESLLVGFNGLDYLGCEAV
jgi:hypothetical protein